MAMLRFLSIRLTEIMRGASFFVPDTSNQSQKNAKVASALTALQNLMSISSTHL